MTSFFNSNISLEKFSLWQQSSKSFIFFPLLFWILRASFITLFNNSPTFLKSFSLNPRDVNDGEPNLIPPGLNADLSPGTEFLFIEISTNSANLSILLPDILFGLKSTNNKWLSVPPVCNL